MSIVIRADELRKEYRRYHRPFDRLKEVLPFLTPRFEPFVALDCVSFAIESGETVGVVGQNGAGKSTLLQLLAGVLDATSGTCEVHGRVGSLLELGAGFHPEFTGLENIRLQGHLVGMDRADVEARIPEIRAFAEIGSFVEQPVRSYSSGMFVRLAFATAIHFDPEVLIVDEALSVGDVFFQHKCIQRIHELQKQGKTILVVSHDPQTIRHICDRAMFLSHGRLMADGDPADVVAQYLQERGSFGAGGAGGEGREGPPAAAARLSLPPALRPGVRRHGAGGAQLLGAGLYDERGHPLEVADSGVPLRVRLHVRADRDLRRINVGFMLQDKKGLDLTGSNLAFEGHSCPRLAAGEHFVAEFAITLPELASGSYSLHVAAAEGDDTNYELLDWVDQALVLELRAARKVLGHMRVPISSTSGLVRPGSESDNTESAGIRPPDE